MFFIPVWLKEREMIDLVIHHMDHKHADLKMGERIFWNIKNLYADVNPRSVRHLGHGWEIRLLIQTAHRPIGLWFDCEAFVLICTSKSDKTAHEAERIFHNFKALLADTQPDRLQSVDGTDQVKFYLQW